MKQCAFRQTGLVKKQKLTENNLLKEICEENFFGTVICDIHIFDHLKHDVAEFTPLFKNVEITHKDIGPYM